MNLDGRTCLVTGASSGIGASTARALGEAGSHVILVARSVDRLDSVADDIRSRGGRATVAPADVTSPQAVSRMAETVLREIGTPDVIVNNAGAGRFLRIEETSPDEAVQMMAAPYFAAFFVTRAFIEPMLARGSGTVLQVNSPVAWMPWPGAVGYAAARYALRGFTDALRQDVRGSGLHVSSITPAEVDSPYFTNNPGAEQRVPRISRLVGKLTPDEVGAAIVQTLRRDARDVHAPRRWRLSRPLTQSFARQSAWISWRTGDRRTAQ